MGHKEQAASRLNTVQFIENSKFLENFQFSAVLPDPASSVLASKQLVQSGFLVHFNHNHPRYINKPKKHQTILESSISIKTEPDSDNPTIRQQKRD